MYSGQCQASFPLPKERKRTNESCRSVWWRREILVGEFLLTTESGSGRCVPGILPVSIYQDACWSVTFKSDRTLFMSFPSSSWAKASPSEIAFFFSNNRQISSRGKYYSIQNEIIWLTKKWRLLNDSAPLMNISNVPNGFVHFFALLLANLLPVCCFIIAVRSATFRKEQWVTWPSRRTGKLECEFYE